MNLAYIESALEYVPRNSYAMEKLADEVTIQWLERLLAIGADLEYISAVTAVVRYERGGINITEFEL